MVAHLARRVLVQHFDSQRVAPTTVPAKAGVHDRSIMSTEPGAAQQRGAIDSARSICRVDVALRHTQIVERDTSLARLTKA
jgi:hypothetical protein